ncbi:hypothetical protein CARUB_v100036781mg, partial [Capsella rubella]
DCYGEIYRCGQIKKNGKLLTLYLNEAYGSGFQSKN